MKVKTIEQQNSENFEFLKDKYWELIVDCIKKGDTKNADFLKASWKEIEEQYKIN